MENSMFCYQCEQTLGAKGCVKSGVCGKNPTVANLQDVLIHELKGIGFYGQKNLEKGLKIRSEINKFVVDTMFSTLTNVNFDPTRFVEYIKKAEEIKEELKNAVGEIENVPKAANYRAPNTMEEMVADAKNIGIMSDEKLDMDIRSLRELLIYAFKGMAAYAHHAYILGKFEDEVNNFFYKGLAGTIDESLTVEDLFNLNMELGKTNFKCMEVLDSAVTSPFGDPEPTEVLITKKKGPFIIVSGHDYKDLKELLEQTEGKGINIYTHCEMLPANAYPELKKHKNLIGNFGGAWQKQQEEFDGIPGCILMTTNCVQKPRDSYKDRLFTTSIVGMPECPHIEEVNGKKNFTSIIQKALELGGWQEDEPEKRITIGFAHNAILSHANEIVEAVKGGKIKHFFLIGGCDGAKPGRNYYTEFAEKTPKDTIILTLACGKYRFNKLDLGTVAGFPRVLDCGQCSDSYSAIKVALTLAEAFNCGVNELPLSLVLSWYEQKAVGILLTLLSLGIKDIRLGPTLPAFITPNILQVLVDKFGLKPISTPEEDLKAILGQ
ncbi:MAG: hydroxylamine reductase [Clostridium butyricum]|jgi:hydroxylamine reductase|uniref:Hydroxylamine reductase n=2 Tax=Clostridium TaxID=1485 RepID=A0A2T0BR02_9CLOT|nr:MULTISPECIES: hydroxylamine reductase [Clostridium]MDK2830137.1 hydroxylamine reductase [Clostridium butyricum]NAS19951.1 hydroxylamine reductase [Clostridium butyricum]NOW24916.1 hydroxylamine reductase [Clostridium butyricum]PRR86310.1 Hydroxylamine reductase [Clostridium luticellarii]RQN11108.1 hydroxylamine reductase [Clostridium butyricum]